MLLHTCAPGHACTHHFFLIVWDAGTSRTRTLADSSRVGFLSQGVFWVGLHLHSGKDLLALWSLCEYTGPKGWSPHVPITPPKSHFLIPSPEMGSLSDGGVSESFRPQDLLQRLHIEWRKRLFWMFEGGFRSLWNVCPVDLELPSWVYCFSFFPPPKGSSQANYSIPTALLSGGQKGELPTQRALNW